MVRKCYHPNIDVHSGEEHVVMTPERHDGLLSTMHHAERNSAMSKRDNETVAHEMKQWFLHCLGCAAGIREFSLGRYTIAVLDETTLSDSLIQTYQQFLLDLRAYRRVG